MAAQIQNTDRARIKGVMNLAPQHAWAVFLAGGDGTRLRSLTSRIAGDSRPKQFCRIFGDKSLLSQTRDRMRSIVPTNQTIYVVSKTHDSFYREELRDVDDASLLVQPENRGTGVAILAALLRIQRRDAEAIVTFLPCDHYYSDNNSFAMTIKSATARARRFPASVILLGAKADYPEIEYGWIEPGASLEDTIDSPLLRVNRFWEKPSLSEAEILLRRGCLWNTFVTIGSAGAFLELLRSAIPDVVHALASTLRDDDLGTAYRKVASVDFSRDVLAPQADRLLVVRDIASGWADLGNPDRVIHTMVRNGIEPAWLRQSRTHDNSDISEKVPALYPC